MRGKGVRVGRDKWSMMNDVVVDVVAIIAIVCRHHQPFA
jgi:hypothetical protein